MLSKKTIALYKIGVAVLVFAAVITQYICAAATRPNFDPVNFFSFFTIQSNILAAFIFAGIGIAYLMGMDGRRFSLLRGAATVYMTITGIVYSLLLAGTEASLGITLPWVNFVLHYLFPLVAFADWFIDRPAVRVTLNQSLWWLLFPVIYLSYSLTRGALTGWYPYPFLDPANGGYGSVAFVASCIALGGWVLCALFARLSNVSVKRPR